MPGSQISAQAPRSRAIQAGAGAGSWPWVGDAGGETLWNIRSSGDSNWNAKRRVGDAIQMIDSKNQITVVARPKETRIIRDGEKEEKHLTRFLGLAQGRLPEAER